MDECTIRVSPASLFTRPPTLFFEPSEHTCPFCSHALQVQKSRTKMVITLDIGAFKARETIRSCRHCNQGGTYGSGELAKLKPFRSTFGYDVLVYVGKGVFQHCRNEKQIQCELAEKRIVISEREIAYLAKKFVVYLALAHRHSRQKLRALMARRGGYILHLDATCEGDSPHLMSGLDGTTEIVLENVKLASEKAETIIPFLRTMKRLYGTPLATVHDMGRGISHAVQQVFPDARDLICHYHFLRDVGKDLFGAENDKIRARLRKHGIQGKLRKRVREYKKSLDRNTTLVESLLSSLKEKSPSGCPPLTQLPLVASYALMLWALEGKKHAQGYGFPFDRPYLAFYHRLQTLQSALRKLKELHPWERRTEARCYGKVLRELIEPMQDAVLRKAAEKMQEKGAVFDKLREAMRIAMPGGKHGLNDRGEEMEIHVIEERVKRFCDWVSSDEQMSFQEDYKNMIAQVKHYWEKLFADPLVVDTPDGKLRIQPQRTNNVLEQLFRDLKRRHRKKSGMNALVRTLKAMLSDTPLVKNLDNPEYLKIILDGRATLEERFADIDAQLVKKELSKAQSQSEKVPPKIKKIVRTPQLPAAIITLFTR